MRATLMYGAGHVRVENVPDAPLMDSTDALVRVTEEFRKIIGYRDRGGSHVGAV